MDAFFASVEQLDHPELRGKPVAVGGSGERSVVAAASYEARKFGVRSAMPSVIAKRLCPDLIFVRHSFDRYREISASVFDIYREYTDLVEPLSIDEAFLDVTEDKKNIGSATLIAKEIRSEIKDRTGLTASAGISVNKFLAKIASDINKPDGLFVIAPEEAEKFILALPVEKFYGIGKVTAQKMHKLGIHMGSDLRTWDMVSLVRNFGKAGVFFFDIVRGKEEWSVKIFSDTRALCHRIDELSEPAAALEKEIMASSPGKAFLLKRKKTELVENEMARLCKFYGQQYYNTFERLSESVFLNNLQPKELTGRTDNMILNASFLIVKSKVKEFQDCAGKLIGEAGSLGFNIEISGPWPPFSFVAVK